MPRLSLFLYLLVDISQTEYIILPPGWSFPAWYSPQLNMFIRVVYMPIQYIKVQQFWLFYKMERLTLKLAKNANFPWVFRNFFNGIEISMKFCVFCIHICRAGAGTPVGSSLGRWLFNSKISYNKAPPPAWASLLNTAKSQKSLGHWISKNHGPWISKNWWTMNFKKIMDHEFQKIHGHWFSKNLWTMIFPGGWF